MYGVVSKQSHTIKIKLEVLYKLSGIWVSAITQLHENLLQSISFEKSTLIHFPSNKFENNEYLVNPVLIFQTGVAKHICRA